MIAKLNEKIREYSRFLVNVVGEYEETDYDIIWENIIRGKFVKELPLPDSNENIETIIRYIDAEMEVYRIKEELYNDPNRRLGFHVMTMLCYWIDTPPRGLEKTCKFLDEHFMFVMESVVPRFDQKVGDLKSWENNIRKSQELCKEAFKIFKDETGFDSDNMEKLTEFILNLLGV